MIEELAQEVGTLIVFLAGISYIAVGIYLLQTTSRENGGPSFFLGCALLLNGFSFAFSEFPYVSGVEQFTEPLTFISRIFSAACSISIALFTWRVFRSGSGWGGVAIAVIAVTIAVGLVLSALQGDWEGYAPLTGRGFWFEWAGCTAPFIWMAIDSLAEYRVARRRISIGLIDPIVSNRFFLIGIYSTLASLTYVIYIPMYIIYELHGVWSGWLDVGLGLVEVISVVALFLSFSAPPFYRRWIGAAAAVPTKQRSD